MRFDYHSPNIKYKSFHLRRFITSNLVFIGLGCVLLAIFARKNSEELVASHENVHRPIILSKSKPVLDLDSEVKIAHQDSNQEHVAIIDTALEKWQSITVQVGDTISKLFEKLDISTAELQNIITSGPARKELTSIYPGQELHFLVDERKELKAMKLNLSSTKALHVTNTESGFKYHYEEKQPIKKLNFKTAKITGSLYMSAQSAGLNDKLIMQMADILGWDIDFSLDIRDNDSFKILYEEEYVQDKKIDSGKILAVEFNNQGKLYKAIRYTDDKGHEGYYSPDGFSLQKAFLRSPVAFTRISSHFSHARRHPILHKFRSHKGVDYAAPAGTPIKSAGDGRVTFLGNKGGYGKSIEITHGQKYSTFYAHLSRFGSKLKHGSTVKQGQIIGYVGKTGLATGPHLHYEFRINGVHHNPVTVPLPRSQPIPGKSKTKFSLHANSMLDLLNSHSQLAKND